MNFGRDATLKQRWFSGERHIGEGICLSGPSGGIAPLHSRETGDEFVFLRQAVSRPCPAATRSTMAWPDHRLDGSPSTRDDFGPVLAKDRRASWNRAVGTGGGRRVGKNRSGWPVDSPSRTSNPHPRSNAGRHPLLVSAGTYLAQPADRP
jgi:hypothetical protein